MKEGFYTTRDEIVYEMNTLIRELNEVATELQWMQGIGSEYCISKLRRIATECEHKKNQLIRL